MERPLYILSDDRIEFIRSEVGKSAITLPNLEEELIDHICCLVEEYLAEGYTFEEAYRKVRKSVGINLLKDIEIRSLLLIDKKIQSMKTTLKITGIAGISTLFIASIFKIMHWPGAGILIFAGFLVLTLAYLPFLALTIKKENILKSKKTLSFIGIITAFVVLVSILFTIMHWPYQEYLIYSSWIIVLVFLIMLLKNIMKSEENRILNLSMLLFFAIIFILDASLYLVNLKNPKITNYTLEKNLEESQILFEQKSIVLYQKIDTIRNFAYRKDIEEIRSKTDSMIIRIELLQKHLFSSEEEKEQYNRKLFKGNKMYKVEDEAIMLGNDISEYQIFLVDKAAATPNLIDFIKSSIQFGNHDFYNAPPVIYNNLGKLIRDIRIIESELVGERISK